MILESRGRSAVIHGRARPCPVVAGVADHGSASAPPTTSESIAGNPQLPAHETAPSSFRNEELNSSTRGQWELFRSHREQIERLILRHLPQDDPLLLEPRPTRFCALGAGNCNDLDLRFLCDRLDEVHLLDIDATALELAVRRQKCSEVGSLHRHAPVDLTEAERNRLSPWHGRPAHAGGMGEETLARANDSPLLFAPSMGGTPLLRGRFEIVLSCCVLSQLIAGARDRLGPEHPRFPQERAATILHHLRLMLDLVTPGGSAILITDIVSTDTMPQLRQVPPDDLPGLMRTLVTEDKTFRGLDPATISTALGQLPQVVSKQWSLPWLWHLSALRSYMVYGIVFSKASDRKPQTENRKRSPC